MSKDDGTDAEKARVEAAYKKRREEAERLERNGTNTLYAKKEED